MDFRLKVFRKVADKLSFTKAAEELFITQPAVTKHINAIEEEFNTKLFNRKGNRIELTNAGSILLRYAKKIENLYSQMDFEISALNQKHKGELHIGASTTLTQYVLPRLMAKFKLKFDDLSISVINGNTEQIENALRKNEIDLGIIEGFSKQREFHYLKFLKDEIVLVAKREHALSKTGEISLRELQKQALILREEGSGTLQVISHYLKSKKLSFNNFNIEMRFGNTEGIKSYILNSNALAFISIHSIYDELKRNELSIIDIKDFEILRDFNFIFPEGQKNSIVDLFIQFCLRYNF